MYSELEFLSRYRNKFKTALVGSYVGGRYVEPPIVRINSLVFLVPIALSVIPVLLFRNLALQWIVGVGLILTTYLSLYHYLRGKCFTPDVVRVVKTNYGDVEWLRRNKIQILENPQLLPGDYEMYYDKSRVCVSREKRPVAFTLDGPKGPVVYFTTGLYARLSPEELEAVLAHERGHVKYRHTYKLLTFLIAEYSLRLPMVYLVYSHSLLLLAIHLLGVAMLFAALLQMFELEADQHAAVGHREKLISALVKLDWNGILESLANPTAVKLSLLARTHPPTLDRLKRLHVFHR